MTEKRDLNNELILLKKTIQQAKVCVIGKLVRKLKEISNLEGKELTALKTVGKRARLTDQINYLKKISNLELASLALTFDKNPAKILTNNLSSIEDASLANIVTFKNVSIKVNQIKSKLGLDESGCNWREKVSEIGKKKKKKIEKETNKIRNKERKETNKKHKELDKKRDEWLGDNTDVSEKIIRTEGEEDKFKEPSDKTKKITKNSIISIDSDAQSKVPPKKKAKSEPMKIVDSFFITGSGENYLATNVIDRIQARGPDDGLDRKERRAQQFGNKPKAVPKRQDIPSSSEPSRSIKPMTNQDDLHPSWAAKMKSKGIDKFQGKKMKFGDEEPDDVVDKTLNAQSQKDDTEKIHPSWAAKQKLKPVITEFKGNKIVFDD